MAGHSAIEKYNNYIAEILSISKRMLRSRAVFFSRTFCSSIIYSREILSARSIWLSFLLFVICYYLRIYFIYRDYNK